jgi:hypothetical protein
MIPRVLAIVATVLLLCGCRTRDEIPDDGLDGQTFHGIRFTCDDLWIEKNGHVTGTLTIENDTYGPIAMYSADLRGALHNLRSRIGTPNGSAFAFPPGNTKIPTSLINLPAQSTREVPLRSWYPMAVAWLSLSGPIPVRLEGKISVEGTLGWEELSLVVDATLRRR